MQITSKISNINFEIKRKLFHLTALWIPLCAYILPFQIALIIFFSVTLLIILIDLGRFKFFLFSRISNKILKFSKFESLYRDSEKNKFSGASNMMLSATISFLIFELNIFIIAFLILIISDALAAIIGIKYGKHKLCDKSWEGSITFFISGCMIIFAAGQYFNYNILAALWASLITTIAEANSTKLKTDDNLLVPLVFGSSFYIIQTMV